MKSVKIKIQPVAKLVLKKRYKLPVMLLVWKITTRYNQNALIHITITDQGAFKVNFDVLFFFIKYRTNPFFI